MQRFSRSQTSTCFDPNIEPIGTVRAGERFIVETADSACGLVHSEADVFASIADFIDRVGGPNPVTGPVQVEGCRAGDCLAITIEDVRAAPRDGRGWSALMPGWGGLTHDMGYSIQDSLPPRTVICEVTDEVVRMPLDGRLVTVPAAPFVGTVGVAPRRERRMTLSQSAEYGGDLDLRALRPGATLLIRANVDGGLVGFGDVHACQGEGEITGVAVEVEAEITVRIDVRPAEAVGLGRLPLLETEDRIGAVAALGGVPLTACVRAGYAELCGRLQARHGYSREAAYMLLGQAGRVEVGNMIDPFYSCLVSLDRKYFE